MSERPDVKPPVNKSRGRRGLRVRIEAGSGSAGATVPWEPVAPEIVEPHEDAQEETPDTIPDGYRRLTYTGRADVVEYGEFRMRPGQPVLVPSKVAEELLTMPFESFLEE
jgi:hypothetical protein